MAFVATKPSAPDVGRPAPENGVYIVQMIAAPAVSYSGGIAGYNATAPRRGQKINPLESNTLRYVGYLKSKHDQALRKVHGGQKVYDYAISYNGFAAKLTAKQAAALKKQAGVLAVTPDEMVSQDTSSTPHFLGLDAPGGIWQQLGGPTGTRTHAGAGENIVIGVVDSGIWPQSKSFSDRDAHGKLIYQPFGGRHGRCEDSSADGSWSSDNCNKKLMWARHFNAAWGGDPGIQAQRPWEFLSPRDYNGHGTHTRHQQPAATTALRRQARQLASARLVAWHRVLALRCTKRFGQHRMRRPRADLRPTSSPPLTRQSLMVST